ncbi:sporulation protein YunB [Cytobacillus gottheilii]|uniref:Sporulation protein YunB n=1 Tax=Cytobacillus gottheilii TaxID=859144 RepID=A0ABX8F6S7_9BACI|nr:MULTISPECIES: sporulation protein YunB [Bacillaceae]QVY60155.1 sporulation protein YunB [Cytobacillus gottheilii]
MFRRKRKGLFKGPLPAKHVFFISLILFVLLTFFGLLMIDEQIEPVLMDIAETRAKQFSAQAINDAITKELSETIDVNELIVRHGDGENAPYSFNQQVVNKVMSDTNRMVQEYLDLVEQGELEQFEAFRNDSYIDYEASHKEKGIIYRIPLGMATKQTLFSNLGPKVPIKFELLGHSMSNVETKILETGINNTYLEVYVKVQVQMKVIIPLVERDIVMENSVKVGDLFYPGKVPQYFNGGSSGQGDVNPVIIPQGGS